MSDEIDWDRISRSNFAGDLTSTKAWFESANELFAAASVLEPSVLDWWESLRAWSKGDGIFREHGFHSIYMMLSAFAVENLCKGALVFSLTHEERERVREEGRLPARFKSHDLPKLVAQVGLTIDLQEESLLRRMQRAAVWHARYPVPQFYRETRSQRFSDGVTYSVSAQYGNDISRVRELIRRLRGHLDAPETYRVSR